MSTTPALFCSNLAISCCVRLTISISNNLPKNKREYRGGYTAPHCTDYCRKVGSACGVRIPASVGVDGDASPGSQRRAGTDQGCTRLIRLAHVTPAWAMALAPAAPNTEGALVEIRSVRTRLSARRHSRLSSEAVPVEGAWGLEAISGGPAQ